MKVRKNTERNERSYETVFLIPETFSAGSDSFYGALSRRLTSIFITISFFHSSSFFSTDCSPDRETIGVEHQRVRFSFRLFFPRLFFFLLIFPLVKRKGMNECHSFSEIDRFEITRLTLSLPIFFSLFESYSAEN